MTVVITVVGRARGADRAAIAANLAVPAAAEGLDTALVDADPRTGGAAAWWARHGAAPNGTGHGSRFLRRPPGRLRRLLLCSGAFGADLAVVDAPAGTEPSLAAAHRAHGAHGHPAPRACGPTAGSATERLGAGLPLALAAANDAPVRARAHANLGMAGRL